VLAWRLAQGNDLLHRRVALVAVTWCGKSQTDRPLFGSSRRPDLHLPAWLERIANVIDRCADDLDLV
jgi:hypothetical protein